MASQTRPGELINLIRRIGYALWAPRPEGLGAMVGGASFMLALIIRSVGAIMTAIDVWQSGSWLLSSGVWTLDAIGVILVLRCIVWPYLRDKHAPDMDCLPQNGWFDPARRPYQRSAIGVELTARPIAKNCYARLATFEAVTGTGRTMPLFEFRGLDLVWEDGAITNDVVRDGLQRRIRFFEVESPESQWMTVCSPAGGRVSPGVYRATVVIASRDGHIRPIKEDYQIVFSLWSDEQKKDGVIPPLIQMSRWISLGEAEVQQSRIYPRGTPGNPSLARFVAAPSLPTNMPTIPGLPQPKNPQS